MRSPGTRAISCAQTVCVNDDGDFEKTFDNGARLTAYLLNAYGLDTGALLQHFNFNGKNCPMTIRDNGRWDAFVGLVEQYRSELK